MVVRRTYPHRTPPPKTLRARPAPLSRARCVSRSILPRISLSPPQPPKRSDRLARKVARCGRMCNSSRSFDSLPLLRAHPAVADAHGLDAVLAHRLHADRVAVVRDHVAALREPAELAEHEDADGV